MTVTIYRIVCVGHNFDNDEPLTGTRKTMILWLYKRISNILLRIGLAIKVDRKILDVDYSEYLGKDYKKTQQIPEHVSTYVSNHVSWADIIVFIYQY